MIKYDEKRKYLKVITKNGMEYISQIYDENRIEVMNAVLNEFRDPFRKAISFRVIDGVVFITISEINSIMVCYERIS